VTRGSLFSSYMVFPLMFCRAELGIHRDRASGIPKAVALDAGDERHRVPHLLYELRALMIFGVIPGRLSLIHCSP